MRRAARLVVALALGWMMCWLPLGLAMGRPTLLLHPQPDRTLTLAYLAMLYLWLVLGTLVCWRRWGPHEPDFRCPRLFGTGVCLGIGATVCHRAVLYGLGLWTPPLHPGDHLALALLTSPLLAMVEEAVFRGYLFGTVREDAGRAAAYLGVNGFFALVHLFRPGWIEDKACLGLGLLLAGLVLSRLAERSGSLWPGIGLHTVWIVSAVVDPPSDFAPHRLAARVGEPAAGGLGWLMLLGLFHASSTLVKRPSRSSSRSGGNAVRRV